MLYSIFLWLDLLFSRSAHTSPSFLCVGLYRAAISLTLPVVVRRRVGKLALCHRLAGRVIVALPLWISFTHHHNLRPSGQLTVRQDAILPCARLSFVLTHSVAYATHFVGWTFIPPTWLLHMHDSFLHQRLRTCIVLASTHSAQPHLPSAGTFLVSISGLNVSPTSWSLRSPCTLISL